MFHAPKGFVTDPNGINASGLIAGSYEFDKKGNVLEHGYLRTP